MWITMFRLHTTSRLASYRRASSITINIPQFGCKEFHIPRTLVNFKNVATSSRDIFA